MAVCQHCLAEIEHKEVLVEGHLPQTGWTDGHPRYPFYCPKARNFNHVPKES